MARYKLLAEHVIADVIFPTGTEVGEGTGVPFDESPSNQMEGLDDEGRKKVNELHQALYGHDAPWHTEKAEAAREADRKVAAEEAQKEEEADKRAAVSARPVTLAPQGVPPRGGVVTPSPGVSTPKVEPVRVTEPNKEQYPKG